MTTSSTIERRRPSSRTVSPSPRPASGPPVEELRARSSATLTRLVTMLGYPPHWAGELERRSFAAGRVWSEKPARS